MIFLAWIIQNGVLTNSDFVEKATFSVPFPFASWRIANESLRAGLMPDLELIGAFANDTSLSKVIIPKSVKFIGENAFRNTALSSVKISSDCVYSQKSFPDGCKIEFY